jgi:hypothetical protein
MKGKTPRKKESDQRHEAPPQQGMPQEAEAKSSSGRPGGGRARRTELNTEPTERNE